MAHPESLRTFLISVAASLLAAILFELCRYAYQHGLIQRIYLTILLGIERVKRWAAFSLSLGTHGAKIIFLHFIRTCIASKRAFHRAAHGTYSSFDDTFGSFLKTKRAVFVISLALVASLLQDSLISEPERRLSRSEEIAFETFAGDDVTYKRQNRSVHLKKAPPGTWSYRITSDWDTRLGTLELFRNRLPVFATQQGDFLTVVRFDGGEQVINDSTNSTILSGELRTEDITGDSIPDLLLITESSGTSGYRYYSLMSLGEQVEEIYSQDGCHFELKFEDLEGDGIYEAITQDLALITGYIGAGIHPTGPVIDVILKHDGTGFQFATTLMKQRAPTEAALYAEARKARQQRAREERLTDDVYEFIVKLVYSGNGEVAHRFVRLVFSEASPNTIEFNWYTIYEEMMHSPHWTEIASLNKWEVDQYAFKECRY